MTSCEERKRDGLPGHRRAKAKPSFGRLCPAMTTLLRPFHLRRHRRQDRIDIATGLEAECGAAVVEQVEFDVATAAHQLLLAIGCCPGRRGISSPPVAM